MAKFVRFVIDVPEVDITSLSFPSAATVHDVIDALKAECPTLSKFVDNWDLDSFDPAPRVRVVVRDTDEDPDIVHDAVWEVGEQ